LNICISIFWYICVFDRFFNVSGDQSIRAWNITHNFSRKRRNCINSYCLAYSWIIMYLYFSRVLLCPCNNSRLMLLISRFYAYNRTQLDEIPWVFASFLRIPNESDNNIVLIFLISFSLLRTSHGLANYRMLSRIESKIFTLIHTPWRYLIFVLAFFDTLKRLISLGEIVLFSYIHISDSSIPV